mmetsp:Transcript_4036/g.9633  ORF Transcript_4036/g.9633 Transcript_4036/m.9633 type:complete len:283 (+) Transcript_4036:11886-12734(+)
MPCCLAARPRRPSRLSTRSTFRFRSPSMQRRTERTTRRSRPCCASPRRRARCRPTQSSQSTSRSRRRKRRRSTSTWCAMCAARPPGLRSTSRARATQCTLKFSSRTHSTASRRCAPLRLSTTRSRSVTCRSTRSACGRSSSPTRASSPSTSTGKPPSIARSPSCRRRAPSPRARRSRSSSPTTRLQRALWTGTRPRCSSTTALRITSLFTARRGGHSCGSPSPSTTSATALLSGKAWSRQASCCASPTTTATTSATTATGRTSRGLTWTPRPRCCPQGSLAT